MESTAPSIVYDDEVETRGLTWGIEVLPDLSEMPTAVPMPHCGERAVDVLRVAARSGSEPTTAGRRTRVAPLRSHPERYRR